MRALAALDFFFDLLGDAEDRVVEELQETCFPWFSDKENNIHRTPDSGLNIALDSQTELFIRTCEVTGLTMLQLPVDKLSAKLTELLGSPPLDRPSKGEELQEAIITAMREAAGAGRGGCGGPGCRSSVRC